MKIQHTAIAGILGVAILASPFAARGEEFADTAKVLPKSFTVKIGNRLYPDYSETVRTSMHERIQVGDTDYSFEAVEFYPHFAIAGTDSTKEFRTLSDEPKNPAFQIRVYEGDDVLEDAWAFYSASIPHFSRESFLYFEVLEFEYRGTIHSKSKDAEDREDGDEETKETE